MDCTQRMWTSNILICLWYLSVILAKAVFAFDADQASTHDTCNRTTVYNCIKPFYHNENLTEAIFPKISEAQMRHICNDYTILSACLNPIKDACTIYEEYYYLGLEGSFEFVCEEENIQTYLRYADCLGDKDLISRGQACLREFYVSFYLYYSEDKICGYIDTYLQCNKQTVKDTCGKEAAAWQYEVNFNHMAAVIKDFQCKLGAARISDGTAAAITVTVILIIVGAICIVIWACRRQIADRIAKARSQHIKHYDTQTNEETSRQDRYQMNYPSNGYDQEATDYRLEYRRDLGNPDADLGNTTGVINPGYMGGCTDDDGPVATVATSSTSSTPSAGVTSQDFAPGTMLPAIQVTDTNLTGQADVHTHDVLI